MGDEGVILLHGLARTWRSMSRMAGALERAGYRTVNTGYPSRQYDLAGLADRALPPALDACRRQGCVRIHVVTHSMGGIVLRQYLRSNRPPELGRVVMLSPPNQGSEIVDRLIRVPGFRRLFGPAACQLGTSPASAPNQLGAADFKLGVLTGNFSLKLFFSRWIPGENDGKVAVRRACLEGMADFLVLPYGHSFIMARREVIAQVLFFLRHGSFIRRFTR